ncbi:MAG TPA: helix-turn-helix transcriptional regulator [Vicinamibacterales bacterium]|nr:helix-turn-helix transcriptional regulator [Vicinamibacterales bacterium]
MRRKPGSLLPLEVAILSTIARLRRRDIPECHGYEIARHLREISDRNLLTAYGTLYRALGRLKKMGLLKSRWEDPQVAADEARPGRRLYALTGAGAAARAKAKIELRAATRRGKLARA